MLEATVSTRRLGTWFWMTKVCRAEVFSALSVMLCAGCNVCNDHFGTLTKAWSKSISAEM